MPFPHFFPPSLPPSLPSPDILQNQWSPIYDVSAILTSIQSLLCDPNPASPANSEASRLYQVRDSAASPFLPPSLRLSLYLSLPPLFAILAW